MSGYLLQEDGVSRLVLEDGSGDIVQEVQVEADPTFIGSATVVYGPALASTGQQTTVTTPGTYTWVCPPGVTHIYVEAFGGGGAGAHSTGTNEGYAGGGGGAYAARTAVPVTPGTTYTFVVGAGGARNTDGDGTDSTFTGDSRVQVTAKGGKGGSGLTAGTGGAAASSTGDTGHVFSGGSGGAGVSGPGQSGSGGGASGNHLAAGNNGATGGGGGAFTGGDGGSGANGGGSGGNGNGSGLNAETGTAGSAPGGGGGGSGGESFTGWEGGSGQVYITTGVLAPFIASNTAVYTPTVPITPPFIGSTTTLYSPSLPLQLAAPFISSATVVYTPAVPEIHVPFLSSSTRVFRVFSVFNPDATGTGPGNGGETFALRLAPNGSGVTATLVGSIGASDVTLTLSGDAGMPTDAPFVVTIDGEILYLIPTGGHTYVIRGRALGNTTVAGHAAGASVAWGDTYGQAIVVTAAIDGSFTADVNGTGSFTYPGWLIPFDSTQAYLAGDRYPMHVAELVGVFDAGAGTSGSNRCDAAQPNAIATPTGVSDDCPAALGNPSRIQADIAAGDVAVVRYTNPEATVLDLGPRSVAIQSWFGLKRVDAADTDVTFTDPNGIVVDTTGGEGTYTGSVNGEWFEPSAIGIAPDTGEPTPNPVPWASATLPGTQRYFTYGSAGGGFDEKGWPIGVLAVRQGNRRVPHWVSYDWHDYSYVYAGFGTDDTFAQVVVNRNGILFDSLPDVELPGPQDITGPDAIWDDDTYYFGASWYVAIFAGPYIVLGPVIGGTASEPPPGSQVVPVVTFPSGGSPVVTVPGSNPVEGGQGGDIDAPGGGLHVWARV